MFNVQKNSMLLLVLVYCINPLNHRDKIAENVRMKKDLKYESKQTHYYFNLQWIFY